jgi:excisionase family DNA binding protein
MTIENLFEKLEGIELKLLNQKQVLNSDEAAALLSISKSHLFKLTSANILPYSKPHGKLCYFLKSDLEKWLMSKRTAGRAEMEAEAANYIHCKHKI